MQTRGVGRMTLFEEEADCRAFLDVGGETLWLVRMSICGCCVMLNPAYFLLWTVFQDDLSSFQQRLTNTHVQRWQHHRHQQATRSSIGDDFSPFPSGEQRLPSAPLHQAKCLAGCAGPAGRRRTLVERQVRLASVEPFAVAILKPGQHLATGPTVSLRTQLAEIDQPTANRRESRSIPADGSAAPHPWAG